MQQMVGGGDASIDDEFDVAEPYFFESKEISTVAIFVALLLLSERFTHAGLDSANALVCGGGCCGKFGYK